VVEQSGEVIGVVEVLSTALQGIAVLGIFVDPAHGRKGVGRALFEAAIVRARILKAGALVIYASPFAEGFYSRLGAIGIGEGPLSCSPEVMRPTFCLSCLRQSASSLIKIPTETLQRPSSLLQEDHHATGRPFWEQLNGTAQRASQVGGLVLE
jgi:predicted N-acetyltransferase YhbS